MSHQPFVYGLYDPDDATHVRYVGMAPSNPTRPFAHARRARQSTDDTHLLRWIRKIQAEGREPSVLILEQLSEADRTFLGFVESCYIRSLRQIGHQLTNENDGGWGGSNGPHSEEARQRMRAAWTPELRARNGMIARARNTGTKLSDETRAKQRAVWTVERRAEVGAALKARNTGSKRSEETKTKISAKLIGTTKSEVSKDRMRIAHLGKKFSDETKAKMSASRMGNTNALGFKQSDDTKAKRSASLKAAWARRKAQT